MVRMRLELALDSSASARIILLTSVLWVFLGALFLRAKQTELELRRGGQATVVAEQIQNQKIPQQPQEGVFLEDVGGAACPDHGEVEKRFGGKLWQHERLSFRVECVIERVDAEGVCAALEGEHERGVLVRPPLRR